MLILIGVLAILILAGSIVFQGRDTLEAQQQTDTAQSQLGAVADPLSELCRTDASVRARVGAACGLAQQAVDDPEIPTPGPKGDQGSEGRGVVSTSLVNGELIINYSDGSRANLGPVIGSDGSPGVSGSSGIGITGSTISGGRLVLSFSDGTSRDVGQVVGTPGDPGAVGPPGGSGPQGRGVSGVSVEDGRLVVTYTDGASEDAGPLPPGPAGATGPPGPAGQDARLPDSVTRNYSDGSTETCSRAGGEETAPVYSCTRTEPPLIPGG